MCEEGEGPCLDPSCALICCTSRTFCWGGEAGMLLMMPLRMYAALEPWL